MIDIVRFFNDIDLPTRSCCENNDDDDGMALIVFDIDDPLDYKMHNFIKNYTQFTCCCFNIWVRPDDDTNKLLTTWTLEIPSKYLEETTMNLIMNYK